MLTASGDVASELVLRSTKGRIALAATVGASAMASLDATVVNVALPHIGGDLDADVTALQWVLTGYLLGLASFILLAGALGDRLGRRRIFLIGTAWFAGASLLCGLAPSIGVLVATRILQGVGGALLTPGSMAILQASFRESDRAVAVGRLVGARGRCRRHRALHRRRAGGRTRVAMGVPDQRSPLHRGHRVRPHRGPGEPGRACRRQARRPRRRLQRGRTRVRNLGAHRGRDYEAGATPAWWPP